MCSADGAEKLAFLSDPRHYPGVCTHVRRVETHYAWLFLTPRHVYKLKKPLRADGIDYRSLAARRRGCLEELRLNRRLAGSTYERVLALERTRRGTLRLGPGHGRVREVVRVEDYLVQMRRLPSARMLDQALRCGRVSRRSLERVLGLLVQFFARAPPEPLGSAAYLQRLRSQITENRRSLLHHEGRVDTELLAQVLRAQRRFVSRDRLELGGRGARVVEGHGDLRAEHVCLGPPLCVIDCLEFNAQLRRLDPAEEIAFLALEIERLGGRVLWRDLLRGYCTLSGSRPSVALLHFYMSHRAVTRAKLASWHLGDPQFPDERPWVRRTDCDLRTALRHVLRALRALEAPGLLGRRPAFEQHRERLRRDQPAQRLPQQSGYG